MVKMWVVEMVEQMVEEMAAFVKHLKWYHSDDDFWRHEHVEAMKMYLTLIESKMKFIESVDAGLYEYVQTFCEGAKRVLKQVKKDEYIDSFYVRSLELLARCIQDYVSRTLT